MARSSQAPCRSCKKPAYGRHCRPCSFKLLSAPVRNGNAARARTRTPYNQIAVIAHRSERDVLACPESWWALGLNREQFAERAARENVTRLRFLSTSSRTAQVNVID